MLQRPSQPNKMKTEAEKWIVEVVEKKKEWKWSKNESCREQKPGQNRIGKCGNEAANMISSSSISSNKEKWTEMANEEKVEAKKKSKNRSS